MARPAAFAGCVLAFYACCLLVCSGARGDVFSNPSLVSYGDVAGSGFVQQAEYAHDSAISGDGRYVAFDGAVGGVTGVWRKDLATGIIEQVAGGDAAYPSISKDGRYVAFTTNEGTSLPEITDLLPDSSPRAEAVNVYRRDMLNAPAASAAEEAERAPEDRAFQAASAASGAETALSYSGRGESGGSYAVGRTAMSADGNEVAFVTVSVSNLVAYPALEEEERTRGDTPVPHTPAGQVAVHRFDTGLTELVGRCRADCEQGAAEPVVASEGAGRSLGAAATPGAEFPRHGRDGATPGASISADGSTVAWLGVNLAQQAQELPGEDLEANYEEPLWRRLPASGTQTRRVTGGSDPEAPGCAASGELELTRGVGNASDPCQGPFLREQATSNSGGLIRNALTPRLSRDGELVVFGANARLLSEGNDFNRGEQGNPTDLFVVNMANGLTRSQALTPLTEVGPETEAQSSEVTDAEISPDGGHVAFSTIRTAFSLGWPTLISIPAANVTIAELFDVNLANGTLTRVTHGYGGEGEQSQQPHPPSQGGNQYDPSQRLQLGALAPEFSSDGQQLVFTSTAANLVYGDGNSPPAPVICCQPGDGSDVFAVSRSTFKGELAPLSISPPPTQTINGLWRLSATARARRDGSVVVYARLPGAGRVHLTARGAVVSSERRPAGAGRSGRRAVLLTRTLAEGLAAEGAQAGGLLELVLRVRRPYASLAARRGGLPAVLAVTFTSPGKRTLRQSVPVSFRRVGNARGAGNAAHRGRRR